MSHSMSMKNNKQSVQRVEELPFLLRVVWFVVLGWEITGVWILVAWFLNLTVIGLPLGLWMMNRVPQVLTLKARPGAYLVDKSGRSHYISTPQHNFFLRAAYFILFGWWVSLLWAIVAYILCITIIGLPLGVMMLNSLPNVTTLQRE